MRIIVNRIRYDYQGRQVDSYSKFFVDDLREMGHEVLEVGPGNRPIPEDSAVKKYDLFIDIDCGRYREDGKLHFQSKVPIPSAVWFIDSHGHSDLHRRLSRDYDHIFFAVWDKRDLFVNRKSAHWCPNATDFRAFNPILRQENPEFDFGFFGCLAENTKILMGNGSYKNIQEIKAGESVIDKNGNPVIVKRLINSGVKRVYKLSHQFSPSDLYVTGNHKFLLGNLCSNSNKSIMSNGYSKLLKYPFINGKNKIDWLPLERFEKGVFLFPKNITFNSNKFIIDFSSFYRMKKNKEKNKIKVKPTYDLGYIFGTFIGDGTTRINNKGGYTRWTFNITERLIAQKVAKAIRNIFKLNVRTYSYKNTYLVTVSSNGLARLLQEFGKKENKHLPDKYISMNSLPYCRGLLDGLDDSDGDGNSFSSTSLNATRLYWLLSSYLNKNTTMIYRRQKQTTTLQDGKKIKANHIEYTTRNSQSNRRTFGSYLLAKPNCISSTEIYVNTFDLEIESNDNCSFIAENVIVHNSKGGLHRANDMIEICKKYGWTYDVRQVCPPHKHKWPATGLAMGNCRILFNKGQKHDGPNQRVMESMAMKLPLISDVDLRSGMDKLFEDGIHFIGYSGDLEDQMILFRENYEEAELVAEIGFKEVENRHLIKHRVQQILEVCGGSK